MLSWPCGLLLGMPRKFLLLLLPLLQCLPSLLPSPTLWSTSCVSPTFASVYTETLRCYDRWSTGAVRSPSRKNDSDPHHSATRTWASPRAFQMDSRRATGRVCTALTMQLCVMWHPKGLPASWLDPPTQRWQSANSQPNHRPSSSSGTAWFFHKANKGRHVIKKTKRLLNNKVSMRLHHLCKDLSCHPFRVTLSLWNENMIQKLLGRFATKKYTCNVLTSTSVSACFLFHLNVQ